MADSALIDTWSCDKDHGHQRAGAERAELNERYLLKTSPPEDALQYAIAQRLLILRKFNRPERLPTIVNEGQSSEIDTIPHSLTQQSKTHSLTVPLGSPMKKKYYERDCFLPL